MAYKIIGNTTAEWDDSTPFIVTMTDVTDEEKEISETGLAFDLSELRLGFGDDFLLHFRDHLIQRRIKVNLKTIETEQSNLLSFFRKVINLKLFNEKILVIDESFLLALGSVEESISGNSLRYLKMAFISNKNSPMFARNLHDSDFPEKKYKKGKFGRQISRILAKALNRAACVHILGRCEQAYEVGELDIGLFSFINLAFAVFCRPESYRKIRLQDLNYDSTSKSFFIYIYPAKTRTHKIDRICYQINEPLGKLLQKQRQHVIEVYGHLVNKDDVGKMALFPGRVLKIDKSGWVAHYPNQHFGMYKNGDDFTKGYLESIQKLFKNEKYSIGANSLRHTIGTQLAHTGASAQTIKAVLKHAGEHTCRAYVDIAFNGLIDDLSEAMQPAFQNYLPAIDRFRSRSEPIPLEKAIRSDDMHSGQIELVGECGKQIQCEHAPIVCYGCHRFIPCWDVDHSVNLNTVQRELDDFNERGKPFQHLVKKLYEAKSQIIIVMNAADRYRQAMSIKEQP